MISLVVVSDGRYDYLHQCLATLDNLKGDITRRILVHDGLTSLDLDGWETFVHLERQGLAKTVRHAWSLCTTPYLFHLEEDFTIDEPVDLDALAHAMRVTPGLAQLCLLRQPWSPEEHAAGGILELDPDAYTARETAGVEWWEHAKCFSLNPCLVPRAVFMSGWPDGNEAEQTARLAAAGWKFGYVAGRKVTHIGYRRSAGWKL